jgi:hypothetical protein
MTSHEGFSKVKVDTLTIAKDWTHTVLDEHGFYHVKSDQLQPTLDNKIHSLFSFGHFPGLERDTYNKMMPAFRLASLFIQDERMLDWFWAQMINVPTYLEGHPGVQYLNPPLGGRPSDDELCMRWNQQLSSLSKIHRWYIYPYDRHHDFPEALTTPGQRSLSTT